MKLRATTLLCLLVLSLGGLGCAQKPAPQPQPPVTPQPQPQPEWPTDNDDSYVPMNYYY